MAFPAITTIGMGLDALFGWWRRGALPVYAPPYWDVEACDGRDRRNPYY